MDSMRRLEGIVSSAMDGIIAINDEQLVVLFNPAAERMFGLPAAQALGRHISLFMPQRYREAHAAHIGRFAETGVTERQMGSLGAISGLRADGREFPIEASISQVQVGGERLATVILRDITERKAAEEARHLLVREVDHRAKNALAMVQAVVQLTRAAGKAEFIAAVQGRVAALGRAHSLLAQNRWEGGDLGRIVGDETAGHQRDGQIRIAGPAIVLPPSAVQPISLLIHELATNAVKHGALSVEKGRVDVSWTILDGGDLELRWTESEGPAVEEPNSAGFGSTLIREVATRQLGGSLSTAWPPPGLRLVATLPPQAYRADPPIGAAAVSSAATLMKAPIGRRGRLLVVEDESLIALSICQDLRSLGWDIVGPAASVDEARRLLEVGLPDAAVLDVNLAGKLVYPLAEWLRSRSVPFVFCSGYEQLEGHPAFQTWPRVRKPVNIQLLDTELRRVREAA